MSIVLGIERSKVSDGGFGIIEILVWSDSMESRMRQSIFDVTGPVVGYSPK